eukprot:695530-Alexandrium_andersonii.AAC.1
MRPCVRVGGRAGSPPARSPRVIGPVHGHIDPAPWAAPPAARIWVPALQSQRIARIAHWRNADWSSLLC